MSTGVGPVPIVTEPVTLVPANERSMVSGPCVTLRAFTTSVPFSSVHVSVATPIGVVAASVTTHAPLSSLMVSVMSSGIDCPPTAMVALYLNEPAARSAAVFGTPTADRSVLFFRTTVFGSTVISFRRAATSGVIDCCARPPRCLAKNCSAAAYIAMLFTGRAKPCPSSGATRYSTG
jgi:hypothetical protein